MSLEYVFGNGFEEYGQKVTRYTAQQKSLDSLRHSRQSISVVNPRGRKEEKERTNYADGLGSEA